MTNSISITDFSFQFSGNGYYIVTYTSPITGNRWHKFIFNNDILNATMNSSKPKKKDLIQLKNRIKNNNN